MTAVQFDRVSRHYGEVKAVDDISFQIPAGEFFTLLGPSGCGKTTLLRALAGLDAIVHLPLTPPAASSLTAAATAQSSP